jgi:hypothetical protein
VTNRDLSVTVLKYFLNQRKEELASGKLKKIRPKKGGATKAASDPQVATMHHLPAWTPAAGSHWPTVHCW